MSVPYDGQSTDAGVPGVTGTNTAASGVGVLGQTSEPGTGGIGVRGDSDAVGVWGEGTNWHGVAGVSHSTSGGAGVFGSSDVGPGIIAESQVWHAIFGSSQSTTGGAGLWAENQASGSSGGPGVVGISKTWHGTFGSSESTVGGAGVWGEHKGFGAGVVGQSASGIGVNGKGYPAGFFEGKVYVTDTLTANAIQFNDGSIQTTATLQGQPGKQGQPGPPGPAVHTSAVCGPLDCYSACNNPNNIVASQSAPCIATSDTGTCEIDVQDTFCCVCKP